MKRENRETHELSAEFPHKTVVCVGTVVLKDNRVLFIRQAEGQSLAGQWSIPWGFIGEGESPEDAALRETLEESNIRAEIEGLLGIQNLHTSGWLGIVFICHHLEGEPAPDGVETDRAAYFSLEEINSSREPFEPWCRWLARRILVEKYTVIPVNPESPYHPRKAFL